MVGTLPGGPGSCWEILFTCYGSGHSPPGEEMIFDRAAKESVAPLYDVVSTRVVEGSLDEPQIALVNLLNQVKAGNVGDVPPRHKARRQVTTMEVCQPAQ